MTTIQTLPKETALVSFKDERELTSFLNVNPLVRTVQKVVAQKSFPGEVLAIIATYPTREACTAAFCEEVERNNKARTNYGRMQQMQCRDKKAQASLLLANPSPAPVVAGKDIITFDADGSIHRPDGMKPLDYIQYVRRIRAAMAGKPAPKPHKIYDITTQEGKDHWNAIAAESEARRREQEGYIPPVIKVFDPEKGDGWGANGEDIDCV